MPLDAAGRLARARRAYLVAAAGCGKTETVAVAAGIRASGRQLVLTHTHAGVKALKDRLRSIGAPAGQVQVDTIAGFALRYAASFPRRSGLPTTEPREDEEWAAVYEGARRVFDGHVGREVLAESYDGLFVDEYQDCMKSQHDLVMAMAEVLPCRVVLDPLQGIFGFAGPLVSLTDDLDPNFERLPDLVTPWRWQGGNVDLGDWLVDVRTDLQRGDPIDLRGAPIERGEVNAASQIGSCRRVAARDGSVVAIGKWASDCHTIGSRLRGVFTCMERLDCPDLLTWAARIEEATGPARAAAVADFAAACMTRVGPALRPAADRFRVGAIPPVAGSPEVRAAVSALIDVASARDLSGVVAAMAAIERIPDQALYRREMWRDMGRTIRISGIDGHPTLPAVAWHVRDGGRHAGRRVERRTVSRTVLIKGLEFNHAVVLDADRHDAVNLYVALTRASATLTVLSADWVLRPNPGGLWRAEE